MRFRADDADAWFARNRAALDHQRLNAATDPVIQALKPLAPPSVLEVGCANGWRLDAIRSSWSAYVHGIDPSPEAVRDGVDRFGLPLVTGNADSLPWMANSFDCIVFGFCLYLCDRSDLFQIAQEADRILAPGGYLVVYDFYSPNARSRPYVHREGLRTHKMDHAQLWAWHPGYERIVDRLCAHEGRDPADPEETLAVTILKKALCPGDRAASSGQEAA